MKKTYIQESVFSAKIPNNIPAKSVVNSPVYGPRIPNPACSSKTQPSYPH